MLDFIEAASDIRLIWLRQHCLGVIHERNELDPRPECYDTLEPWNPWRALRQQPEIKLSWADIPQYGGLAGMTHGRSDGQPFIRLHEGLSVRQMGEVLTHELLHHERGLRPRSADWDTWSAEEATVRWITRDRMRRYERSGRQWVKP